MKRLILDKLPFILAILLYLLIYFLRLQQVYDPEQIKDGESFDPELKTEGRSRTSRRGGWEIQTELFSELRENLDHKIATILPSPQADLLSGILLGNKKDLPADLKLALRDTSTLHIVVVSGQNLTMVAGLFLPLSWLISRRLAILLSFTAIIFYTLLTGAQVPVLRAALMSSLTFLAVMLGRQKESAWVLIVSGGAMLLVNPQWITDLSFQLSFLATFGVVMVTPVILRRLGGLPGFISQDLAITTAAQLMVVPIIAQNFHQASLVSLITNLLVGWSVPVVMILGSIFLVLSSVSVELAYLVSMLLNALLSYFIYVVEFFASLPFAWEYVGEKSWLFWLGYYIFLAGVLIGLSKVKK